MKFKIEARIKEILEALDQSTAQHNALVGRLNEAKHLLAAIDEIVEDKPLPEGESHG